MHRRFSKIARPLIYLAFTLLAVACVASTLKYDYKNLQAGEAKSARMVLKMHTGDLNVQGGAQDLLNAKFASNVPGWMPEVSYTIENGVGLLSLQQPENPRYVLGKIQYQWDLKLKKDLPIDLQARLTNGNLDLQLGEMDLTRLDASTSSGNITLNLPGNYDLSDFTIDTTSGDVKASLPGSYTLPALNLLASNGKIDAALTGKFNLPILNLQTVNGDVQADLTGRWLTNMRVNVSSESGGIFLKLPTNVGVSATASTNSGQINAPGWTYQDGSYVNDAYGKSAVTIQISAAVVNGDITLELAQ
jgi:DUF4097 and DUF4098 domain-containing protein YvlB